MRILRVLLRSQIVAAAGLLVLVGTAEAVAWSGIAGVPAATLGALAALIVLPMCTQLGLLVDAGVFGLRVDNVVLGATRRVASWRVGRVTFTIRALPLVLASDIGAWRSPVILRCWLAGLTSALAGFSAVAATWLRADGPFGRGAAVAATVLMVAKLRPQRSAMVTSTGWLLFGLPRMPDEQRNNFRAAPLAARAHDALLRGDVETAQAHVDQLAAEHPRLAATASCQITMHEARGEYALAVALLLQRMSSPPATGRELAHNLAALAGLGFCAVESGQGPGEDLLPIARKALEDAVAAGYPSYKLDGTRALLALLEGDTEKAARLAESGANHADSVLSQADDLATLARARMAMRDNAGARSALGEAEALAAWWPRVRGTRERLAVGA